MNYWIFPEIKHNKNLLPGAFLAALIMAGLILAALPARAVLAYGGSTPGAVTAFYYPWYDIDGGFNVWQKDGGKMTNQPTPPYNSADLNTMRRQMGQARQAGIDAFAVSYDARTGSFMNRFQQMLENAPAGFSIAAHFEVSLMNEGDKTVSGVVNTLRHLQDTALSQPHYFRYQGRPVIYFWWPQTLPGDIIANWSAIRQQVDPGHQMIWSVDTTDFGLLNVFDTVHYFSGAKWADNPQSTFAAMKSRVNAWNAANSGPRRLSTASVTPGYDDRRFRSPGEFRDRAGGNYYRSGWDSANQVRPDLITISSWNEWYEGSAIEPGGDWGNLYLDITREKTAAFKGIAEPFGDASILKTWSRTDLPVAQGSTNRSWMWGPAQFAQQREAYADSPGGARMVYYFDKSRMEINRPGGPPDMNDLFYVTNGLLPLELMSGRLKTGDSQDQFKGPAQIPVAGDSLNNSVTPTYAALARVSSLNGENRQGDHTGQLVLDNLRSDGTPGHNNGYTGFNVRLAHFVSESGHNIAAPFWEFMQRQGPVWEDNAMRSGPVVEWLFAMGYPVSEPYWTRSRVGGVEKDVLVQAFERRVLTFTPDNPDSFKVEMGNVGQHYYQWRYGR